MSVLSDILNSGGDPTKVAAALGRPAPIAYTPAAQPAPVPVATVPYTYPAGEKAVPLNVDRIPLTPGAPSLAPVPLINPATLPQLPTTKAAWLDWLKAHWMWLALALLVLLILAYARRDKRREAGFSPSLKGTRIAKGSAEAKAHMARIRAMKRKA